MRNFGRIPFKFELYLKSDNFKLLVLEITRFPGFIGLDLQGEASLLLHNEDKEEIWFQVTQCAISHYSWPRFDKR